jgi:hypothetical protein
MRLYRTPPNTYDLPFTWVYDASGLTNGNSYENQTVYIKGGLGDFFLRRVVGISLIEPNAGDLASSGSYQLQDRNGRYMSDKPIAGGDADDIGIVPEELYPSTGQIRIDLGPVTLPNPAAQAQIAFQGVRRMQGNPPANPTYRARHRTYTYIPPPIPIGALGTVQTMLQTINNYDFELHQIILLVGTTTQEPVIIGDPDIGSISFTGVPGTIVQLINQAGTPNLPFFISVVGNVVTLGASTNSLGFSIMASNLAPALIAANPAAAALITAVNPVADFPPAGSAVVGPTGGSGGFFALQNPISKLLIRDVNKEAIASAPVLDIFCDGGPGGVYQNGAIVTPLWYPQQSQIQIDVFSATNTPGQSLQIILVGKEYWPC